MGRDVEGKVVDWLIIAPLKDIKQGCMAMFYYPVVLGFYELFGDEDMGAIKNICVFLVAFYAASSFLHYVGTVSCDSYADLFDMSYKYVEGVLVGECYVGNGYSWVTREAHKGM